MTLKEARKLSNGIYVLYWKDGGSSLAAVGCLSDGRRWFAPVNWIGGLPSIEWRKVSHAVHVMGSRSSMRLYP